MRKKNQPSQGANASPDDMQNRIDRLEGLVLSLMTNGPQAAGPAAAAAAIAGNRVAGSVSGSASDQAVEGENGDRVGEEMNGDESEVDHVTKRMGIMKVDPAGKAFFASEAHWYAILGEVNFTGQVSLRTTLANLASSDYRSKEFLCGTQKAIR